MALMTIIQMILATVLALVIIFLIFWRFIFMRDPERSIPEGKVIVAPADGKVVAIKRIDAEEKLTVRKGKIGKIHTIIRDIEKPCTVISIFMNPLNVHVNRSPLKGKVLSVEHTSGKFLPVMTFEAGLVNEKTEVVLKTAIGNIKVIQIAGFLARRIITTVKKNDNVDKGERIGMINLGSQVTVIMPGPIKVKIKEGEQCFAGTTVLAEY